MKPRGELAIILHTHMPYVEGGGTWPPPDEAGFLRSPQGFGTWPFGEEWLWEAIATSYLPLLDVLGRAPITLRGTGCGRALPEIPDGDPAGVTPARRRGISGAQGGGVRG
jgi:hypothetical protein